VVKNVYIETNDVLNQTHIAISPSTQRNNKLDTNAKPAGARSANFFLKAAYIKHRVSQQHINMMFGKFPKKSHCTVEKRSFRYARASVMARSLIKAGGDFAVVLAIFDYDTCVRNGRYTTNFVDVGDTCSQRPHSGVAVNNHLIIMVMVMMLLLLMMMTMKGPAVQLCCVKYTDCRFCSRHVPNV